MQEAEDEGAEAPWESAVSSADEQDEEAPAGLTTTAATGEPGGELVSMARDFWTVQQRKEERLLEVLRDLRTSLPPTQQPPVVQPLATLSLPFTATTVHSLHPVPDMT